MIKKYKFKINFPCCSDILLYRMLPRQVADKLKLGEAVEPESFEQATVFFSDVVSFTTLAQKCSPLQAIHKYYL
jgi:class 3 adenylate cyclase